MFKSMLLRIDILESSNIREQRIEMQKKMSLVAAHIRDTEKIKKLSDELKVKLKNIFDDANITAPREFTALMKNRDIYITQLAVLSAMEKSSVEIGSRGSALVLKEEGITVNSKLETFKYLPMIKQEGNNVLATIKTEDGFVSYFEPVREIPKSDDWFENVWREYRIRTSLE